MFEELKNRRVKFIDDENSREYAVMVPLLIKEGEFCVLFEIRSDKLKRQPGEICFPGGARDKGESELENAVRETAEELCIDRGQISVIAQMDTLHTIYNNKVSVFMCELKDYDMSFSGGEVAEVFCVPLSFFLENPPTVYTNSISEKTPEDFPFDDIPGGRNYYWRQGKRNIYFYYYEDYVIWGLTAYIMQSVVKIIKSETGYSKDQRGKI